MGRETRMKKQTCMRSFREWFSHAFFSFVLVRIYTFPTNPSTLRLSLLTVHQLLPCSPRPSNRFLPSPHSSFLPSSRCLVYTLEQRYKSLRFSTLRVSPFRAFERSTTCDDAEIIQYFAFVIFFFQRKK